MSEPIFTLLIPGEPTPKGRPRMTKAGHTYTPERTRDAEEVIVRSFQSQVIITEPLTCPLRVMMEFQCRTGKGGGRGRTDLDNLVKLVWDSLNGIAWADDSQIVDLRATVTRGPIDPFTKLEVWKATGQQ